MAGGLDLFDYVRALAAPTLFLQQFLGIPAGALTARISAGFHHRLSQRVIARGAAQGMVLDPDRGHRTAARVMVA